MRVWRRVNISVVLVTLVASVWGRSAIAAPTTPGTGQQSEGNPLSLTSVLRSVERAHPLLIAASREIDIAEAESTSALGGFDTSWKTKGTALPLGYYDYVTIDSSVEQPTSLWGVTPFAGYRLGVDKFPLYDEKYRTLRYGELRAGVYVPLWRNGSIDRRRANLAKALLGKQLAELSYQQQAIELRRAATHRYWAWVAAGRKLHIAEELLQNVESRQAALSARVESGDLPEIDEADNARALEQRRAQLAQSQRSFEQTALELSLFLRDEQGEPVVAGRSRLPANFPPVEPTTPDASTQVNEALLRRPEAKRLDLQRKQQDIELDFTHNQQAPAIDVQVVGSQDFGPAIPERPDLSRPVLEVGVVVDVPLQNRVNEGRAAALRAQIERTALQQRFASERVVVDVKDALSALTRTQERIVTSHREVELAKRLELAEQQRFEAGDSQLLILNLREQQTAEAELREVDAQLDYQRALADFRAARGE